MGRQASFDLEDLEAAGLELVARQGWEAVSVRSVASELGVSTMALYRIVDDADALRRTIADAAAGRLQPSRRAQGDVVGELDRWARRAHRRLGQHPGLAGYVTGTWTELPRWLDVVETFLARAEAEGRRGPDAVAAVNAVFAYVLARAQFRDRIVESGRRQLGPARSDPGRYPWILRNEAAFATAHTSTHFAIGLDALVSGLRAGLEGVRR